MTYRWGLDLDMSSVRLMRRQGGQWREFAVEKIDGPDIEDRLSTMIAQIDTDDPVYFFLPRDQILYTDVEIGSEDDAVFQIEASMEGRTPYSLDTMQIDWEIVGSDKARVAAIAHETLDEALAFAEMRGLRVAEFSALSEPEDFPRLPDFGNRQSAATVEYTEAVASPIMRRQDDAIARATEKSSRSAGTADEPVIVVDDPNPVMQVDVAASKPLNPGIPLPRRISEPRILTDIAAGQDQGALGDSLAPLGDQATPSVGTRRLALAAVLTVVIGVVIWSILTGNSDDAAVMPDTTEEIEIASAPTSTEEELAASSQPDPQLIINALSEPPRGSSFPLLPGEIAGRSSALKLSILMNPPSAHEPLPLLVGVPLERAPGFIATAAALDPGLDSGGGFEAGETLDDLYIASIEAADIATDAIDLPNEADFLIDELPQAEALSLELTAPISDSFGADEFSSPEVASIDPSSVKSDPDTSTIPDIVDGPAAAELPRPTLLAASIPDRVPRGRPRSLVEQIEQDRYGGRTLGELETIRPPTRPESAQALALAAVTASGGPENALDTSAGPKLRPQDFDAIVATSVLRQQENERQASLDFETPDTRAAIEAALGQEADDAAEVTTRPQNSPRLALPSNASVARQATVEDAIRLNRINLVGVYGLPTDRRALVRLPSGRYIKVKVGDRVDGGAVVAISESEIRYQKGSRTFSLTMPQS